MGLVSPGGFIPLAEEIGLIGQIGGWVIKEACKAAMSWTAPDIAIAVNVSPMQFRGDTLVLDVISALAETKLPAHRLELEITEEVLLENTEKTLSTLGQLHELGVRISLDDFGTGYSSLGYLQKFPFDKIKIDGSFVKEVVKARGSLAIVRAVASLANTFGMKTTAEGIETEEQLQHVMEEGYTEAQGYLFSRPVPAEQIESLLRRFKPKFNKIA
jgi:EAL domain-containing protein (putative c-di-GMP-specific phosphodiesterase class I)